MITYRYIQDYVRFILYVFKSHLYYGKVGCTSKLKGVLKYNGRHNGGVIISDGVLGPWSNWEVEEDCGITKRSRSRECVKNPESPNNENCPAVCDTDALYVDTDDEYDAGCCEGKVPLIKTILRSVMALSFTC